MPPANIGPYRIIDELGAGAYGAVYEGVHEGEGDDHGRRAAIKVLHAAKLLVPEVQNRFVREIAILQRLDHPNIVAHYDCGLHDDGIYCAMELVECGALKDVLQARGTIPWRESAEVAREVALGLDHAHQAGCVHRDLKPANLYLSSDGKVKIGDLGLARDLGGSRLTADGQTMGTWRYMAPEQITGSADIDGRLDLYALGCILFEMLTGAPPFDGPNFAAIFDQHLSSPPPRVDALAVGVPSALADLTEQLLAKRREDRPASGAEVARRIDALLASKDPFAVASPTAERGPEGVATEPPAVEAQDSDAVSSDALPSAATAPAPNLTQRLRDVPAPEPRQANPKALLAMGIAALVALAAWALWPR
jgi:serine/threonine protein kinase